ncbi:MAG: class I SAM-dependent methyltransferase [Candidatus Woesearchaeota archaeon]|jgi:ubiquinone/menaquinone biosynthesis C-methylase UbiE|nr:class I SAM-dependent methyltransferase [Candidatus Woesearchaeota archaeon]MDP7198395.1 class I SAM-dependent methyltransferase [Candidatus Woesearchaeota archaeon]MDP7467497.1 class I SAM-dependent methyltransferase [Candidatus Woesearchaeota archaeon]MDP7647724.1 class I SAM-dependent methyltransferase [Candidatus Woesearchaeota archaeon]|tara:strand:- start:272 stop:985 length:714 start_codon:yes stop_codon:yes gene_type:complete
MKLRDRFRKAHNWVPTCDKLLDIGGDKGDVTNEYLQKAKEVHLLEINAEAVKHCKKHFPKVKAKQGEAEKLPYCNNMFDVVVMTETLEHVQDAQKTISEIHRVLKKDGTLIMSTPNTGLFEFMDVFNLKFRFPFLFRMVKGEQAAKSYTQEPDWHRHYSLQQYKRLLKEDFGIQKVHRGGFFVWPLLWFVQDGILHFLFEKNPTWVDAIKNTLMELDFSIDYGSFAFNIMIRAKKIS